MAVHATGRVPVIDGLWRRALVYVVHVIAPELQSEDCNSSGQTMRHLHRT
jgi:hypothetical protein